MKINMSGIIQDLPCPSHIEGKEVLRVVVTADSLVFGVAPLLLSVDPGDWGVALVDIAHHVALALDGEIVRADGVAVSREQILDRIRAKFDEEWVNRTDVAKRVTDDLGGTMDSYFASTVSVLGSVGDSVPSDTYIERDAVRDGGRILMGRRMTWWCNSSYVVEVEAEKIVFMEGNMWNFEHAAGIAKVAVAGEVIEIPAARVHRIMASDVKSSESWAKKGELEWQMGMTRPWKRSDVGTYYAQLVDGNHRAAAAMVLGEKTIPVYVGENYRDQIRKKDWI